MTEFEYKFIYSSVVFLGIVISLITNLKGFKKDNKGVVYLFILLIAIFLGNRSIEIGVDTENYFYWFRKMSYLNWHEWYASLAFGNEPIFSLILLLCSKIGGFNFALIVISFLMNLTYYSGCCLLIGNKKESAFLLYLLILSSFTCWTQQINVIRSGLAISFILYFIIYLRKNRIKKAILFGLLAVGCHFTSVLFILISICVKIFSKITLKQYCWIYILVIILSAAGISFLSFGVFGGLDVNKVSMYLDNIDQTSYQIGFRPTFVLFNTFFLYLFMKFRNRENVEQNYYIKLYIAWSCAFFLWFAIPYSDRIGAYSWILMPVIIYLILISKYRGKNKKNIYFYCFMYYIMGLII